jgi:tripartite-type tricarboxylate transporter receptor subunit TctC
VTASLSRRAALLGGGAAALASPAAVAQGRFPERPIRLIVPWAPGGSSDSQLRSLAEQAGRHFGQPVVVENRSGAGGTLHANLLAREARPDGYTIGQMHLTMIRRPFMTRDANWDATTDFTHIIGLTGWTFGMAVRADSPHRSLADLLAAARRDPGSVTYATAGIGTTPHLTMEDWAGRERVELTHVPFRGGAEALQGVLSGNVQVIAESTVWAQPVLSGQMRLLNVWTEARVERFRDAPTLAEASGHADLVVTSNYGLSGPPRMDPGVVRALHDGFRAALMSEENARVRERFDMPLVYLDTEQFADFVRRRAAFERELVARLNIRIE